jgi:D-cysteine desulfhydrase
VRESPLEKWTIGQVQLLVKRDDLSAPFLGGNKVRALEFLLAGAGPDERLLTVGATGSSHALAVATYGARLVAPVDVITWPQHENAVSLATRARVAAIANVTAATSVVDAYARAFLHRWREGVRWIPAGASSPLGAIGHVNAALELVKQLAASSGSGIDSIVLPLGSGGTMAGLLVGMSLAEIRVRLVGARVVSRLVANRAAVLRLARRTHALLTERSGQRLPPLNPALLEIDGSAFGAGYGEETTASREASRTMHAAGGPLLDGTYSAKAFAVALHRAQHERVLFWLTFDGRWVATESANTFRHASQTP